MYQRNSEASGTLVIISFILMVPLFIWKGWVLTVLWGWFVSPIFDLPPLSIPVAIGIATITGMLTSRYPSNTDEDQVRSLVGDLFYGIFSPLLSLVIGWGAHFYI